MIEQTMRDIFLFLSKNKPLTKAAKKYGARFGAGRFVAGETLDEALQVIRKLNGEGLAVTIDYLGEFVESAEEAEQMTEQSIEAVRAIGQENLNAQVSLKLTSLGLDLSEELALKNMQKILHAAAEESVFVTIDMEDYARCGPTLALFKKLKAAHDNVGTVLQAYLYRTERDIEELSAYRPNLRLVKGAYKESEEVAFPTKAEVDDNFRKIIRMHLLNGHYTAVATHDEAIIEYTKRLVEEHGILRDQFEFQMLYGIREDLQKQLAREGFVMRVYVPYGTDWYGYFMRRLAERPANAAFAVKGVLRK